MSKKPMFSWLDKTTVLTTRDLRGYRYHQTNDCLLHGFPSTSYDWRHQIEYFHFHGHGIVAPDLLGYGGTDKPTDPVLYAPSRIAKDVVDILDAINIQGGIIAVGHDWGCKTVSRLANLYADRFLGFAFLAVGYLAPGPTVDYQQFQDFGIKLAGYELFGYFAFFSEDDAPKIVNDHFDSFFHATMYLEPEFAKAHFAGTGLLRKWLLENKTVALPDYLSEEEFNKQRDLIQSGGLEGPFCWYKIVTSTVDQDDAKSIPKENYAVTKPVFFGAANKDPIAIPSLGRMFTEPYCANATYKEYDAGHWVMWEAKDKVNEDLEAWIDAI